MDAAPPQLLVDDPRATPAQSLDMDTQRFNGFGATGLASPASNQTTHGSNYTDSTSNLAFSGQGESNSTWISEAKADLLRRPHGSVHDFYLGWKLSCARY